MKTNILSCTVLVFLILSFQSIALANENAYVTDWVSNSAFQTIFNRMVDNRHYTHHVEGRVLGDAIQYRGEFRPFFKNLKNWYSYHGMSDEWYERRKAGFNTAAYRELYHNYFLDKFGNRVHQACWVELFEPNEPPPPSKSSQKEGTSL